MCGVVGYVVDSGTLGAEYISGVSNMAASIQHRGPDSRGTWHDEKIALGHTRLSIIDPSPAGAQPMQSADGRFVISYNGEIYNHLQIRKLLQNSGIAFRGQSDTETLLEAIRAWGVATVLNLLNGMFAFALWDRDRGKLTLARDRFGVKPLLWSKTENGLAFASEMKAFYRLPGWQPKFSACAACEFLEYSFFPTKSTVLENVERLEPGCYLDFQPGSRPELCSYWNATPQKERSSHPFNLSESVVIDDVEQAVRDSVQRQLVSDVPLGAFLSGGVDSSLVVAKMKEILGTEVQTFSIGLDQKGYDESDTAAQVSQLIGTKHTQLRLSPQMFIHGFEGLSEILDEPIGDPSFIPTFLLSSLARSEVKVVLSGDGGDELFAGYSRHIWASRLSKLNSGAMGAFIALSLRCMPAATLDSLCDGIAVIRGNPQLSRKLKKAFRVFGSQSNEETYRRLLKTNDYASQIALNYNDKLVQQWASSLLKQVHDPLSFMQLSDVLVYMPNNVLHKVDKASMAASLEVRVPFLDHGLYDVARRVPVHMKINGVEGKKVLRNILTKHLPNELVGRPKAGFTIPLAEWFRGPLRDWLEAKIFVQSMPRLYDPKLLRSLFNSHLQGEDNSAVLWNALVLNVWYSRWIGDSN